MQKFNKVALEKQPCEIGGVLMGWPNHHRLVISTKEEIRNIDYIHVI